MAMKPYKRAVAITGTYQDRQSGQEKKRYTTVGTLFQYDDGGLALKLDVVPAGNSWNGFVSFYDLDERGASPEQRDRSNGSGGSGFRDAPRGAAGGSGPKSDFGRDLDDEIPF